MEHHTLRTDPLTQALGLLKRYPLRWVVPALVVFLAAATFALLHEAEWQASLPMIVRNEATTKSGPQQQGSFERLDQMQTVQETLLELARSRRVLTTALAEVGAPSLSALATWPTAEDLDDARLAVSMTPPKGAEFGKTEVFYLNVKDKQRHRAIDLAAAVSRRVQHEYQELRNRKSKSVIDELQRSVTLAQQALEKATRGLTDLESQVAGDLAELRILQKSPSGDSDLRRRLSALETELRADRQSQLGSEELHRLLTGAQGNAGKLLATPSRLLQSQPSLRRLKDGLVDAQLRTAQLQGHFTEDHPQVLAAKTAEEEIGRHLSYELDNAVRGVEVELRLNTAKIDQLEQQLTETHGRLDRLAAVRAEYGNRLDEIAHLTKVLQSSQANLAEAEASHAASHATSLITVIDRPETGTRPLGPGRALIVLAGLLGGLAVGFGIVLVTAPMEAKPAVAEVALSADPSDKPARGRSTLAGALRKLSDNARLWPVTRWATIPIRGTARSAGGAF